MSLNQKKIIEKYTCGNEDMRSTVNRSTSLEFYYTKKHLDGLITKNDRVLEVGCATGYYGFYCVELCREYMGVDIVPSQIEQFREKIRDSGLTNISCEVGDAVMLDGIADDSFDVVLCLGPMYHLTLEERDKCMSECRRVCKSGGKVTFAYINKIGLYAGACVLDSEKYPNSHANECVIHGTDDMRPDTYFYTTPEDINASAEMHGLRKVRNLGTDFFVTAGIVNSMSDERFELMRPLYDMMTSHESCTGMSNHALFVCRK